MHGILATMYVLLVGSIIMSIDNISTTRMASFSLLLWCWISSSRVI